MARAPHRDHGPLVDKPRVAYLSRGRAPAEKAKRETEEAEAVAAAELAEREATLKAEQKAARDMRYAARKAAKKGPR